MLHWVFNITETVYWSFVLIYSLKRPDILTSSHISKWYANISTLYIPKVQSWTYYKSNKQNKSDSSPRGWLTREHLKSNYMFSELPLSKNLIFLIAWNLKRTNFFNLHVVRKLVAPIPSLWPPSSPRAPFFCSCDFLQLACNFKDSNLW